jgi:hypothetical protein
VKEHHERFVRLTERRDGRCFPFENPTASADHIWRKVIGCTMQMPPKYNQFSIKRTLKVMDSSIRFVGVQFMIPTRVIPICLKILYINIHFNT